LSGWRDFRLVKATGSASTGALVLTLSAEGPGSFDLLGSADTCTRPFRVRVLRG
jgi:hypothetical protein